MKISDVIQEFVPCEICGNNDSSNFYFHVLGSQAYVKCCECEEEYYSKSASNILVMLKESKKAKIGSRITLENEESVHPLVKVLAQL